MLSRPPRPMSLPPQFLDDLRSRVRDVLLRYGRIADIDMSQPVLYRCRGGKAIRNATAVEVAASQRAADTDGGAGVIEVDGVACYVQE